MKPITRLENFLAKIAGDKNAKNLTPITRKEYYLNEIAETSQPFVVTFSGTTAGGDAACDKTFDEIKAAYNAGRLIWMYYNDEGEGVLPLVFSIDDADWLNGYFNSFNGESGNIVRVDWYKNGPMTIEFTVS